jgi:transcriptional regulator
MYLPKYFEEPNQEALITLMGANPFATLITVSDGEIFPNHLPLLTRAHEDGSVYLLGHMARVNPQWRHFKSGSKVTVIFHGPHTYITPSWYSEKLNVPTWNYAVVHAKGTVKLIEDAESLHSILEQTVNESEKYEIIPWKYELPTEYRQGLMKAIVGFKITVSNLDGKFKLSQNRSEEDRAGVLSGLEARKDEMSQNVLKLMKIHELKR